MSVYRINGSHLAKRGSGYQMSETKEPRKPNKIEGYSPWSLVHEDLTPIGPFSDDLKAKLNKYWMLTGATKKRPPEFFLQFGPNSVSGIQVVGNSIGQVFRDLGGEQLEMYAPPNFWSIKDQAKMEGPYWFANVYATAATVKLGSKGVTENGNTEKLQKWRVRSDAKSILGSLTAHGDLHVWRDTNTFDWFCDDVFRAALEAASSKAYDFTPVHQA